MGEPRGSAPAYRRPVVVVQADSLNRSRIRTVVVAVVTTNLALAAAPGNVLVKKRKSSLQQDSVVNVTSVVTLDKDVLTDPCGRLNEEQMHDVNDGLRLVLGL